MTILPSQPPLAPLARGRVLRHDIADTLRAEILSGSLAPGERVLEVELARRFGVSRQPVREAIRSLEHAGLLTSLPNRGTFVTRVALEDALAIQDIRAELEGLAARLAVANLTAEDFLQLELLVERMRDAGERLAGDELVSLDLAFHELVNARSKHRLLLELLDSVAVYVRGFVVHTRNYWATQASLAFVANSHQLLLDELRTRDPERADRAVHFHVETALASLIGHAPPAGGA